MLPVEPEADRPGLDQYAQDNDDARPAVTWGDSCRSNGDPKRSDSRYDGLMSFPITVQPYIKSYQVLVCPSDPTAGGSAKAGSFCYEQQQQQGQVLGAYAGISGSNAAMRRVLPLSYAANYLLSRAQASSINSPSVDIPGGHNLAAIPMPLLAAGCQRRQQGFQIQRPRLLSAHLPAVERDAPNARHTRRLRLRQPARVAQPAQKRAQKEFHRKK